MQFSIFPHDCYMIAALLLCRYPTLKETHVEELVVPHRMQGGDFLQWLPQKTGGHDYDKSQFHALCGLIPSSQFTKSISGIIDAGTRLWVGRPRCTSEEFGDVSWELLSYAYSCFFVLTLLVF